MTILGRVIESIFKYPVYVQTTATLTNYVVIFYKNKTKVLGINIKIIMNFVIDNPSYFAFSDKDVADSASPHATGSEQYSRSAPARAWADGGRPLSSPRRREPDSPRRKEFRALLRSLSAKEPEQAEAFLKGQPRPGDCAPGDMRNTYTAPRIK